MALQRGSRGRSLTRSPRRKTVWGVGPVASVVAITAVDTPQLWTAGVNLVDEQEVTLIRTRGIFHYVLSAVSSTHGGMAGAAGIGLVTTQAFTAGQASVPSLVADEDWDGWLWHSYFDVRSITATIGDGANAGAIHQRGEIDSKAMRKWNKDMTLFGSVEARTEAGVATLVFDASVRLLVKLS